MFLGVPDAPADRMGDNSLAAVRAWEQKEDGWISRLKEIRADALRGRPEDATYGVLLETLEASRQSRICRPELLPLNQQGGWQIFLPVIAQIQPLGTAELRKQALARWHGVASYIDTEIVDLREGLRLGYTQPRANAETVVGQLNDVLKLPPERSPFAGLAARDSAPGFRDSVIAIVGREILPAATRYRDFLVSEYIPQARTSTALSSLPEGDRCYRALVRQFTTIDTRRPGNPPAWSAADGRPRGGGSAPRPADPGELGSPGGVPAAPDRYGATPSGAGRRSSTRPRPRLRGARPLCRAGSAGSPGAT